MVTGKSHLTKSPQSSPDKIPQTKSPHNEVIIQSYYICLYWWWY